MLHVERRLTIFAFFLSRSLVPSFPRNRRRHLCRRKLTSKKFFILFNSRNLLLKYVSFFSPRRGDKLIKNRYVNKSVGRPIGDELSHKFFSFDSTSSTLLYKNVTLKQTVLCSGKVSFFFSLRPTFQLRCLLSYSCASKMQQRAVIKD